MSTDDPTSEPASDPPPADDTLTERYEIRVRGRLGGRWVAWFDGMTLIDEDDGITVISGPVVDQAALHGQLQKLRDLGISLLSLTRLGPDAPAEPSHPTHDRTRTEPPGAPS